MIEIPKKILIIQTAFIGDAILASSMIESWHQKYPESKIDLLLRKGNESLFKDHPFLHQVLIWDKKDKKYSNLRKLIRTIRSNKYDALFNVQRFAATGLITALSKAKVKVGYASNPFSAFFTKKVDFETEKGLHEIHRNYSLLEPYLSGSPLKPKLYPGEIDNDKTREFKKGNYLCLAPTSVWFTKQWPKENWVELINSNIDEDRIYLLGAPSDFEACEEIKTVSKHPGIINLAGKLSFLESASLMADAKMNYVNDSAPMHIASSMNAPVTAIYCSTLPSFGFGPLSDESKVIEYKEILECRPCGLHGKKECPEGHFKCSQTLNQLID